MEQKSVKQTSIQFRQKKIIHQKVSNVKDSNSAQKLKGLIDNAGISEIESPTPEKPESRSRLSKAVGDSNLKGKQLLRDFDGEINSSSDKICPAEDDSIELPDEYKTLNILFEKMDSSIRLLALRKKLPTFRHISTQVEKLSKRKFLCSHLAQMKYLLPESIEIERILIHDEKTLCMIPEIKVALVKDTSCVNADQSASIALCKAFQLELLNYFKTHPEDTEIPKAMLSEPFNKGNNIVPKTITNVSAKEPPQEISTEQEVVARASHLSSSFDEHFTHKMITETEKITPPTTVEENIEIIEIPEDKPTQQSKSHMAPQIHEATPTKRSSNVDDILIRTPSLQTPKRCVPTTTEKSYPEDDRLVSESKPVSTVRKSLIYSPSKDDGSFSCPVGCKSRSVFGVDTIGSLNMKVQEALETAGDVTKSKENSKSNTFPTNLLSVVDTICFILRSTDCTLVTKQELMHKIIVNNLDIEESGEVEEHLHLLEKLIPDWISKRSASDGDCFYSIQKDYDGETVRAKLIDAV